MRITKKQPDSVVRGKPEVGNIYMANGRQAELNPLLGRGRHVRDWWNPVHDGLHS